MSLAAIRRHSAGAWFGPSYAAERVPTLREALALLTDLGLGANIELKAVWGRREETGRRVADLLLQLSLSRMPGLLISSFQPAVLAAAGACTPGIARGILFRSIPKQWRAVAEKLGCSTIHAEHRRLNPAVVAHIRAAGYPLLAYTVNDPARASTLFAWGVTSVFSDDPQSLHELAEQCDPPQSLRSSS
jgi:glycerophosphoryl diester phosphodiesterase